MQRWGRTAAGAIRFRCQKCRQSRTHTRPDNQRRTRQRLLVQWLIGSDRQTTIARRYDITTRTIRRWLSSVGETHTPPLTITDPIIVLVVDATTIVRHQRVVLIAYASDHDQPVDWSFASRESFWSWYGFFVSLKARGVVPQFIVSDGQKGLLAAAQIVWPSIRRQRCIAHIIRQGLAWLTRSPKTHAGQELRRLVCALSSVHIEDHRHEWEQHYAKWRQQFDIFLKERTRHPTDPRRWWYTHRKLRAVRSLVSNALPDLFTYIAHPLVPRTTNHVEGGINAPLKELFRNHRGIVAERKTALVRHYLVSRQRRSNLKKKPTRNVR